jgi:hypothetical protein
VTVYAVCGKKLPGYKQMSTAPISNPSATQTFVYPSCPPGKFPVGGGVNSASPSLYVNVGGLSPDHSNWVLEENNASGSDSSITVYTVCVNG